jgi:hypothetical protein
MLALVKWVQAMIRFFQKEIVDRYVRENFQKLSSYLRDDTWRKGNFKFFTHTFTTNEVAAGQISLPHNLGFVPKDVIVLSVSNPDSATVTWHYDDFTRENVAVTASAVCTVRAYVGVYKE